MNAKKYLHLLISATLIPGTAVVSASPKSPLFTEEATLAGLKHSYDGPWEYFVGGGVASFDCNGDEKPELFLAGGTSDAKLYRNDSQTAGELSFSETDSGLNDTLKKDVTGAYPLNLDNDLHTDLIVLRRGENILLRGMGDCSFENANEAMGFDGGTAWTTGVTAIVEPGQEFPTLAFGNYIDQSQEGAPFETCHDNRLVRAAADPESGNPKYNDEKILSPGYCALSLLFTDWKNSGQFDLRISNDRQYHVTGEEQMWQTNSDGKGTPRLYTREDGWQELVIWGMGIAEGDLDADGIPEYALTSMKDTKVQQLNRSADGPSYSDIAFKLGATAHRPYTGDNLKPSTGWHSQFADVNNDGLTDLYIAKGNVHEMPQFAAYDPDNLLLGSDDGPMVEAGETSGISANKRGRGAVIEDLNGDGLLDIVVVNREANIGLFRNVTRQPDNFLRIKIQGGEHNVDAIGAKIKVTLPDGTVQRRTIAVGGGHASGQTGYQHFGMDTETTAQVEVNWIDGTKKSIGVDKQNQHVLIQK